MFSVWFACNTCRESFQKLDDFLVHKIQRHLEEFQNTKCIIFEERRILNNEQTDSFSPTPQEIGETNPYEFINTQPIKIENENNLNFDDHTNSKFQSHTEDQTLKFIKTDFTKSSDQDFQNEEAEGFISSKNGASATNSDLKFKPTVNTSSISENPTATNGTCLDKDSCENSKTIFEPENKADSAINLYVDAVNSSDLFPTQFSVENQQNPFVPLKRLSGEKIQRWSGSGIDSEKTTSIKYTGKADSFHSIGKCPEKNVNNVFECQLCQDRFNADWELRAHANSCILSHSNRTIHAAEKTINKQSIFNENHPQLFKTVNNDNDKLQLTDRFGSGSKKFNCDHPYCGKSFQMKHHFQRHMATHSQAKPFNCPEPNCEETFKIKDSIHVHVRKVHRGLAEPSKKHQVNFKKQTTANSSIPKPLLTQSSRGLFKCPISSCPKTFQCKSSISLHMIIHSGLRPFKCTQIDCGKTFQQRHHLTRHIARHSDAKPFKCRTGRCQKTFKTSDNYRSHMIHVHSHSQLKKCAEVGCKKMFKSKQSLREHQRTHQYIKPNKCSEIEAENGTNTNSQDTHSAIKIDSRLYKCKHTNCGKQFSLRCMLKRHKATHSDTRPFTCPEPSCLKAFKGKKYLLMHGNCKLGRKNDSRTDNKITEYASLKGTTQDQDAFSTDSTSFKCNKLHCGKQFRYKCHLNRHFVTVHSGLRPFKCPVSACDYTFKQKNHLKTHLLTKKHTDAHNSQID